MKMMYFLSLAFLFYGCCGVTDCIGNENTYFEFSIKNSDGRDLFLGSNPLYNLNDFTMYTLDSDTMKALPILFSTDNENFIMAPSNNDFVYLNIKGDVDTLSYFITEVKSKCCGTYPILDSLTYNGTKAQSNGFRYTFIKK